MSVRSVCIGFVLAFANLFMLFVFHLFIDDGASSAHGLLTTWYGRVFAHILVYLLFFSPYILFFTALKVWKRFARTPYLFSNPWEPLIVITTGISLLFLAMIPWRYFNPEILPVSILFAEYFIPFTFFNAIPVYFAAILYGNYKVKSAYLGCAESEFTEPSPSTK